MSPLQGSSESGCGYFQWFFDDVVDEKDQFIKKQNNRLEKLQNELDGAKMEIHHLKERKDGLKHKIMELQIEMKKMMNSQKKWKRFFFIMLVVVIWMML
jgi:peptidoglycan hydrolase CwlO-like protein